MSSDTVSSYLQHLENFRKREGLIPEMSYPFGIFIEYLMTHGEVQTNPFKKVNLLPHTEKKLPEILSNKEVDLLLDQPKPTSVKGLRDKAMLELLYATGIRVSELVGINVDDVNLKLGFLHCTGAGKDRIIPLYNMAVKAVGDYVKGLPDPFWRLKVNKPFLSISTASA